MTKPISSRLSRMLQETWERFTMVDCQEPRCPNCSEPLAFIPPQKIEVCPECFTQIYHENRGEAYYFNPETGGKNCE